MLGNRYQRFRSWGFPVPYIWYTLENVMRSTNIGIETYIHTYIHTHNLANNIGEGDKIDHRY